MSFVFAVTLLWIVSCVAGKPVKEAYENVALRGHATQSSLYKPWRYMSMAGNAIDGNLDSNFYHGSCVHSGKEFSPWWRLDLQRYHVIHHITITNRGDCCGARLDGAEILVGNSLANNGNNNPRCSKIINIADGVSETFQCGEMVGRYVNIVITGREEFLHFCEVQVFGIALPDGYDNIAQRGRVTQSSVYKDAEWGYLALAVNAIDGNHDPDYYHGSCFHSSNELSPWWRVDLLGPHKILLITITNRGDCCGARLDGAEILVGSSLANNGNNNPRCRNIISIAPGATQTFQCDNMVGRYVNIVIPGRNEFLNFCEVEIFGIPHPGESVKEYENVALKGHVTQSSLYKDVEWGYLSHAVNAIDGNLDGNYFHGSCFHSDKELSPWWRVDLLRPHKIHHIAIINRGDCCGERLNGAEILIGNSLENNGNNNRRCARISNLATGSTETIQCSDMVGRYVNIILGDITGYLSICEVQIFGTAIGTDHTEVYSPSLTADGLDMCKSCD